MGLGGISQAMTEILTAISKDDTECLVKHIECLQGSPDADFIQSILEEALQKAVSSASIEIVKVLLDHMPNSVDFQNMCVGTPAAVLAAEAGRADVLGLLLDKGCPPCVTDLAKRTPLHWSCMQGHLDVTRLLVEQGASVNHPDQLSGYTPLSLASRQGHESTVKFLLKHGARTDVSDRYGETALHEAVRNGQVGCARALLKGGARVDAADLLGRTPAVVAVQWKRSSALALLIHWNCDIDVAAMPMYRPHEYANGRQPQLERRLLDIAICERELEMAEMLLSAGARTDILEKVLLHMQVLHFDDETLNNMTKWVILRKNVIPSLFHICRTVVRHCLRKQSVNIFCAVKQLPIPVSTQNALIEVVTDDRPNVAIS